MATDAALVQQGYEETVVCLFAAFFQNLAGKDPQAAQHFQDGVKLARSARDQALKLIA